MKLAIKTNVPSPYKQLGQVFSIFFVVGFVFCWGLLGTMAITNGGNLPTDFTIITFLMLPVVPAALMLLAPPVFLGGYPFWVVNLFGERFLSRLINSLMVGVQLGRKKVTHNEGLFARLNDRRIAFVVFIVFCIVAGILSGIGY